MTLALILLSIAVLIAAPVFALGLGALVGAILDQNHGQSPRERVSGWVIEWDGATTFVPNVYPDDNLPPTESERHIPAQEGSDARAWMPEVAERGA